MIPVNLKIKNFFSHKETEVDFTKFNAALLIGNVEGDYSISNGSGKSAIFEAVLWCLFNKSITGTSRLNLQEYEVIDSFQNNCLYLKKI